MDRVFLEYYEEELTHIRVLASEFANMHPAVARNLSLDAVPCPDPYVERLLDGVAFLAARTRLKLDAERPRFARSVIELLYPDLVAPTPSMAMVVLVPGQQVETMLDGYVVKRGARMKSSLSAGLLTRSTFTTAQDVTLWPIRIVTAAVIQDRSALAAAGIRPPRGVNAEAALRLVIGPLGKSRLGSLALDRLDLYFGGRSRAAVLFDTIFSACCGVVARAEGKGNPLSVLPGAEMVGIGDGEALLARTRPTFEGYRLLREYFCMPERFHYVRVNGLGPVVRRCNGGLEIIFLLKRAVPELSDVKAADFELFVVPIINLFERECSIVDLDGRRTRQVLHVDRMRPRDFEVYRPVRVQDADLDGHEAEIQPLFGLSQNRGSGWVYSVERRPARPTENEQREGMTRSSYMGDDVFLAISRPLHARTTRQPKRLDVVALCTNRDLTILDDSPSLSMEGGDPVQAVRLLGALKPPRPAIPVTLPASATGDTRSDELAWRLIAQLSLNFLSLAEGGQGTGPLHALLDLYADRGDPALARNVRSIARIDSRPIIERLPIAGPLCFGRGTEIVLHVDESVLAGQSRFLMSALLARLFARYAGINGFVLTRTRLLQKQEDVSWPIAPGNRYMI